jgi:hypothetical protein
MNPPLVHVMAGRVMAIATRTVVVTDGRDKHGHDGWIL